MSLSEIRTAQSYDKPFLIVYRKRSCPLRLPPVGVFRADLRFGKGRRSISAQAAKIAAK